MLAASYPPRSAVGTTRLGRWVANTCPGTGRVKRQASATRWLGGQSGAIHASTGACERGGTAGQTPPLSSSLGHSQPCGSSRLIGGSKDHPHPPPANDAMKFLTTNFVRCAVKGCQTLDDLFPLRFSECQLVQQEVDYNPEFICHMLDRLEWPAVLKVAQDLGNTLLPPQKPEGLDPIMEDDQAVLRDLHTLLVETQIIEGQMQCGHCEHIYHIKNSIPNFLLPPHLANQ